MSQTETCGPKEVLFFIRGVFKTFGLNTVLKGIDLDVDEGEMLTLIGGNGTGENIPIRIIMDIYQSNGGELVIANEKIHSFKPSMILAKGVYMVPQEPMLFLNIAVEENIPTGFKERTGTLRRWPLQIMDDIGWHLDLNKKAMNLSMAEQQLVELLRRLLRNVGVLILDKPTDTLMFGEVESLFKVVRDLKQKGIGIVYITHHLAEMSQIVTHVAIMRDRIITLEGCVPDSAREMLVKGLLPPNMDMADLRDGKEEEETLNYEELRPIFELRGYTGYGFEGVNLKAYPGEVLGVVGVVGAGRMELVTTISGGGKASRRKAVLGGRDIAGCSTIQVLEARANHMFEDRRFNGLFVINDVAVNTTSSLLRGKRMGGFFLNKKAEREMASRYIDDFRAEVAEQDQIARSLSGGSQQKITIGRSLSISPKLVILDEPIHGIDAAAREGVYSVVHRLKTRGAAAMPISPDTEEIIELSGRTVVVFSGRIKGELTRAEISQTSLMAASFSMTEE